MSAISKNDIATTSGSTSSKPGFRLGVARAVADQQVAADGDRPISPHAACGIRFHHAAWVYPCEFSTSFMPATASAITGVGCATAGALTADHSSVCSCAVLALIVRSCSRRASCRTACAGRDSREQRAHFRRIRRRQQVGAHVFGADRVGFRFFEVLALIVTADRHRKAEADDEAEQRQGRGQDHAEILARAFIDLAPRVR